VDRGRAREVRGLTMKIKWIPISTLPHENQKVLVSDGKIVTAAEFRRLIKHTGEHAGVITLEWGGCELSGQEWYWDFDDRNITHWAELPEPPNGK